MAVALVYVTRYSSEDAGTSGFPMATTAPAASVPKNTHANGGTSGRMINTRSPRRTPEARSSDPNARARSATSA